MSPGKLADNPAGKQSSKKRETKERESCRGLISILRRCRCSEVLNRETCTWTTWNRHKPRVLVEHMYLCEPLHTVKRGSAVGSARPTRLMVTSLWSRGKQIRNLAEWSKGASCFGRGQLLVQNLWFQLLQCRVRLLFRGGSREAVKGSRWKLLSFFPKNDLENCSRSKKFDLISLK